MMDELPPWVMMVFYIIVPGGGVALFTTALWKIVTFFRKRLFFTVSIQQHTEIEQWVEYWLSENKELQATAQVAKLTLESSIDPTQKRRQNRPGQNNQMSDINDTDGLPKLALLPMPNETYRISFKNKWIWVCKKEEATAPNMEGGVTRNTTLTVFNWNQFIVKELVIHARQHFNTKLKEQTIIWSSSIGARWGSNWRALDPRPSRPMRTVLLQGDVAERLTADVKEFLDSADWYYRRGIPYRRGYLLYGPPGCGKTSFMTALAGELNLVICIVNLSSPTLNDDKLVSLFSEAPRGSILLLEDVDAAFKEKDGNDIEQDSQASDGVGGFGRNARKAREGITFSGLLNAIDGVAAQEGKVLFMTTNHIEELDEALIRPGRVDVRAKFDLAAAETAGRLFSRFYELNETERSHVASYPDAEELQSLSESFAKQIPEGRYSMALIQGHLMDNRKSPRRAVKDIASLHRNAKAIADATSKRKKEKEAKKSPQHDSKQNMKGKADKQETPLAPPSPEPLQMIRSQSDEITAAGTIVHRSPATALTAKLSPNEQQVRRRRKPAPPNV